MGLGWPREEMKKCAREGFLEYWKDRGVKESSTARIGELIKV
uniref:Uncharacterized protein n=1 Tax=Rhizophora mucronata TaxID=61149 RepID=A0A2P2N0I0_RHIMU